MASSKKVYIAARFDRKDEVKELQTQLQAAGHTITGDWTVHESIGAHVRKQELARQYAVEDAEAVRSAEIVIVLIEDYKSTGSHIELGIAIGANVPEIYLVGNTSVEHMFYYHPKVKRLADTQALLSLLA